MKDDRLDRPGAQRVIFDMNWLRRFAMLRYDLWYESFCRPLLLRVFCG